MDDLESHEDNEGEYRQPDDPERYPAGTARSRPVSARAASATSVRQRHRLGRLREVMVVRLRRKHPRLEARTGEVLVASHVAAVMVAALARLPPSR
jgi:hypothetical protein